MGWPSGNCFSNLIVGAIERVPRNFKSSKCPETVTRASRPASPFRMGAIFPPKPFRMARTEASPRVDPHQEDNCASSPFHFIYAHLIRIRSGANESIVNRRANRGSRAGADCAQRQYGSRNGQNRWQRVAEVSPRLGRGFGSRSRGRDIQSTFIRRPVNATIRNGISPADGARFGRIPAPC